MSVLWVDKKGGWALCWVSFTALWPRQQKGQQKQPETAHLLPIVTTSDGKPALFQKHWTSCQQFQSELLTPGTMCLKFTQLSEARTVGGSSDCQQFQLLALCSELFLYQTDKSIFNGLCISSTICLCCIITDLMASCSVSLESMSLLHVYFLIICTNHIFL